MKNLTILTIYLSMQNKKHSSEYIVQKKFLQRGGKNA